MGAPDKLTQEPQSSITAALARLEARAESSASGWRLLMYAIILAPLAIAAPLLFGRDEPLGLLGVGARVTFGLGMISVWYGMAIRRDVRRRLEGCNLAASIASGQLTAAELREALPWPWKGLIGDGDKLENTLTRVANNLDWYLNAERRRIAGKSPRKLFRASWLYLPLCAIYICDSVYAYAHGYGGACVFWWTPQPAHIEAIKGAWLKVPTPALNLTLSTWFIFSTLALLLPLPFIYYRRQVWTQELARYLRAQIESEGASTVAE